MAVPFHVILEIYTLNYRYCCVSFTGILASITGTCRLIFGSFAATAIAMPTSLYMYHKMIGSSDLASMKYVVCIKHYKLHKFDECMETIGGVSKS